MNAFRVFACAVFAWSAAWTQDFEGSVTFRVTGNDDAQSFEYWSKGNKARLEMGQAQGMKFVILMDAQSENITMLMPDAKMYIRMTEDMGSTEPEDMPLDFQRTGKTQTILGYSCEQVIIRQGKSETEAWVTKALGKFMPGSFKGESQSPVAKKISEELMDKGYFPLKMINRLPDGSEEMRMEATAVQKKKLADDLFAIPAGYKEMQIPPRQ